jgi:hypothetical protein
MSRGKQQIDQDRPATYQLRIQGRLGPDWADWLGGMTVTPDVGPEGVTVLQGTVLDQAALHGLLTHIRDLGLPLLSVTRAVLNESLTEDDEEAQNG